ncbi:MAG TPA: cytochrome c maturation protein CcmE, partial [Thiohalobacter sp.]|nr:cytochrome c maturation protein CcmE [Thiohalobacter sp.]
MKARRRRRLYLVGLILIGVGAAVGLTLNAFNQNLMFFYSPSEIAAGAVPGERMIRLGGLVEAGSVVRRPDGLTVRFDVTDRAQAVRVEYTGILPDLFREGQGVVAHGRLDSQGRF